MGDHQTAHANVLLLHSRGLDYPPCRSICLQQLSDDVCLLILLHGWKNVKQLEDRNELPGDMCLQMGCKACEDASHTKALPLLGACISLQVQKMCIVATLKSITVDCLRAMQIVDRAGGNAGWQVADNSSRPRRKHLCSHSHLRQ